MRCENFFDKHVRGSSRLRLVCSQTLLKLVEIGQRITQTINVIDAQSRERRLRNQPQNVSVRGLEYKGILDSHSDQFGDGKKAPIIDAFIQVLPEGERVVLLGEQALQHAEADRVALLTIHFRNIFSHELCDLGAAVHNGSQAIACRLKAQAAFSGRVGRTAIGTRRLKRGSQDAGVFVISRSIFWKLFFKALRSKIEDLVVRAGRHRQKCLKILKKEAA